MEQQEYQWELEEEELEAALQPRQSRRHRLNNNDAASTNSNDNDTTITNTTSATTNHSVTAIVTGSATPSFPKEEEEEEEEEEANNNNSDTNQVDNYEYNNTATITEFHEEVTEYNGVCFDNGQGTYPTHEFSGITSTSHECSVFETKSGDDEFSVQEFYIPKAPGFEVNSKYGGNLEDDTFSSLSRLPVEKSSEAGVEIGVDVTEKIDQPVTKLDVEAVLERQETHDLYCPNCNSCITRRIILRRRKRKVRNLHLKLKHDKYETVLGSDLVTNPANAANQDHDANNISSGSPTRADDEYTTNREVDIFRCLSCFSIFIPSGDCFNLFWKIGDSHGKESMQNSQKISASSPSWFFSGFPLNKGKMTTDQEDNHMKSQQGGLKSLVPSTGKSLILEESSIEIKHRSGEAMVNEPLADQRSIASSSYGASHVQRSPGVGLADDAVTEMREVGKDILNSLTQEDILGNVMTNVEEKLDGSMERSQTDNMLPQLERDHSAIILASRKLVNTGNSAGDACRYPQQGGEEFLVPSIPGFLMPEQSQNEIEQKSDIAIENKLCVWNGHASSIQDSQSPSQAFSNKVHINYAATEHHKTGIDAVVSSEKEKSNVIEKLDDTERKNETGENTIVIVEVEQVEPAVSQRAHNIVVPVEAEILPQSRTQIYVGEQIDAEVAEAYEWDILKSIVYGGLIESITSLGVVLSAAGADAASLNILALGLANLIGGLFIIGHNLIEVRNETSGGASNQMNMQEDRYQELLGRRANFGLHAIIAVLSFLISGLVPPLIYGVLFRKNDNREFKLVAVVATSLVCIIFLAIGKAYTQKPPKSYIRTVVYYVSIALMASGVSYIAGYLIKELLEKFGWFESSSNVIMPFSENRLTKQAWASN